MTQSLYNSLQETLIVKFYHLPYDKMFQARKVSGHVFVSGVHILPLSTILVLEFGTVPPVWYFLLFTIL